MNKKALVILCSCAALVLLVLIGLIAFRPDNTETQTPGDTEPALSVTEDTQEAVPTETEAGTEPGEETEAAETTEATEETTKEEDDTPAPTTGTQAEKETTPNQDKEENTEPTTPTIPPENVEMGTTEGEKDEGIPDEDVPVITPTQPDATEPEETQPDETEPGNTQPGETEPEETTPSGGSILGENFDITTLTYEGYHALTGEQQKAVIELFGSPDDFMVWYKAVEEIYKNENPDIEIGGDGSVDMG